MIRPASLQDEPFIANLATAFDRFGPYVPVFKAMLRGDHSTLRQHHVTGEVAIFIQEEHAGQTAGFVAVEWRDRLARIHGVVVQEGSMRRGVATQLLDHVEQLARENGIAKLECITAEVDNAPALRCFTKRGFRNHGRVGRYPQGQPAVQLRWELVECGQENGIFPHS